MFLAVGLVLVFATQALCEYKYVDSYFRRDGTYVSGYYRDTSNDGFSWNNANEVGYNRRSRPEGIW